jgi:hypothetical protein
MRTSLFVSSLFVVSLIGGAALADKPTIHAFDKARSHGDIVDKSYKTTSRDPVGSVASSTTTAATPPQKSPLQNPAASRINCAESVDCGGQANKAHPAASQGSQTSTSQHAAVSPKAPKTMEGKGGDRMSCNEGDDCTISSAAANGIWAKQRAQAVPSASDSVSAKAGQMTLSNRKMNQEYEARMSCNEGDDCTFSSKQAQKIWRTESFKHHTSSANKPVTVDPSAAAKQKAMQEKYEPAKADDTKK